jgi:hypothetical protein
LIGAHGRPFFTHIDTHRILPLPNQSSNVNVRFAFEIPERQRETLDSPYVHADDAEFQTEDGEPMPEC